MIEIVMVLSFGSSKAVRPSTGTFALSTGARPLGGSCGRKAACSGPAKGRGPDAPSKVDHPYRDRKSTRLNSSHQIISYAVFCLKKKNKTRKTATRQI